MFPHLKKVIDNRSIGGILKNIDVFGVLLALEIDMGMECQVFDRFPGDDGIGRELRDVVGKIVIVGEELGLADFLPCRIEVGGKCLAFIAGREFQSVGVDIAGIEMFCDLEEDEVTGTVAEGVQLEVETGQPLGRTEGKLEGVE